MWNNRRDVHLHRRGCWMLSPSRQEELTKQPESADPADGIEQEPSDATEQKVRCLCGKWWCYRSGERLVLRCKLCRRDIVISGENLEITYR